VGVNFQVHARSLYRAGKELPVPIAQGAGWTLSVDRNTISRAPRPLPSRCTCYAVPVPACTRNKNCEHLLCCTAGVHWSRAWDPFKGRSFRCAWRNMNTLNPDSLAICVYRWIYLNHTTWREDFRASCNKVFSQTHHYFIRKQTWQATVIRWPTLLSIYFRNLHQSE
jgi:hypothetical protein